MKYCYSIIHLHQSRTLHKWPPLSFPSQRTCQKDKTKWITQIFKNSFHWPVKVYFNWIGSHFVTLQQPRESHFLRWYIQFSPKKTQSSSSIKRDNSSSQYNLPQAPFDPSSTIYIFQQSGLTSRFQTNKHKFWCISPVFHKYTSFTLYVCLIPEIPLLSNQSSFDLAIHQLFFFYILIFVFF